MPSLCHPYAILISILSFINAFRPGYLLKNEMKFNLYIMYKTVTSNIIVIHAFINFLQLCPEILLPLTIGTPLQPE